MTDESLKNKLAKLLASILDEQVDPNDMDANLTDKYGADSMDAVEIADRIEMEFGVVVKNEEIDEIKTFGDAFHHITERAKGD